MRPRCGCTRLDGGLGLENGEMFAHPRDRSAKPRGGNGFQEVIERASLKRVDRVLVERRDENHDRQRTRHKTLHDTEAIDAWHLDIEQEQVGTELLYRAKRRRTVSAFAYDLDARMLAQQTAKPLPGEWFVINDKRANFDHLERKGIITSTVTPFPLVRVT